MSKYSRVFFWNLEDITLLDESNLPRVHQKAVPPRYVTGVLVPTRRYTSHVDEIIDSASSGEKFPVRWPSGHVEGTGVD